MPDVYPGEEAGAGIASGRPEALFDRRIGVSSDHIEADMAFIRILYRFSP